MFVDEKKPKKEEDLDWQEDEATSGDETTSSITSTLAEMSEEEGMHFILY